MTSIDAKRSDGELFCAAWAPPSRFRSSMPWCRPCRAARQGARAHGVRLCAQRHHHEHWNPDYEGKLGELPRVLKPLEPLKDDILLLGNLTHNTGRALLDGAGDHGRCCGSYLTGVQVKKRSSISRPASPSTRSSPTRSAARRASRRSRSAWKTRRQAGDCDSGYSCAYTNNLAWRSETAAAAAHSRSARAVRAPVRRWRHPLRPKRASAQAKYRRSILDFVTDDTTHKLETRLGPTDRRKLDEYLSSIREIERQIESRRRTNAQIDPHMDKPYGVPADFAEHFKLMTDMITVAFQADLTRVVTFLVTREGTRAPIAKSASPTATIRSRTIATSPI